MIAGCGMRVEIPELDPQSAIRNQQPYCGVDGGGVGSGGRIGRIGRLAGGGC